MLGLELAPVLGPGPALALGALLVHLLIRCFVPTLIARAFREECLNMYPRLPVSMLLKQRISAVAHSIRGIIKGSLLKTQRQPAHLLYVLCHIVGVGEA